MSLCSPWRLLPPREVVTHRQASAAARHSFFRSDMSVAPSMVPAASARTARPLRSAGCVWMIAGWMIIGSAAPSACVPAQTTPVVATGQRVVTGNADYDRFFGECSELWHSVEAAERDLPDAQAALARRVGIPEAAPVDVLGARLRERTARLAAEGLTLELEFVGIEAVDSAEEAGSSETDTGDKATGSIPSQPPPTPTATLRTPGREPERRELRLLEVVAQTALSAVTLYAEMGTLPRRTRPLAENVETLRSRIDQAFADASQRARVQSDLAEAAALLSKLNERSRTVANAADTLISLLDEAANTASTGPGRHRIVREAPRNPAAQPAPPSSGSPADRPARPPTPKPAPADQARDFEP